MIIDIILNRNDFCLKYIEKIIPLFLFRNIFCTNIFTNSRNLTYVFIDIYIYIYIYIQNLLSVLKTVINVLNTQTQELHAQEILPMFFTFFKFKDWI